jgi:hypothetical protein
VTTRPAEPGHSHALSQGNARNTRADFIDNAHDFVSRDQWQFGVGELTIDDVQVGTTNAACEHAQTQLARGWMKIGKVLDYKWFAHSFEHRSAHEMVS